MSPIAFHTSSGTAWIVNWPRVTVGIGAGAAGAGVADVGARVAQDASASTSQAARVMRKFAVSTVRYMHGAG